MKEKILIYDPRPFMIEGEISCTSGIAGITSKKQYKVTEVMEVKDIISYWIINDKNETYLVFMPSHGWKLYIKDGNLLYKFKTEKL